MIFYIRNSTFLQKFFKINSDSDKNTIRLYDISFNLKDTYKLSKSNFFKIID